MKEFYNLLNFIGRNWFTLLLLAGAIYVGNNLLLPLVREEQAAQAAEDVAAAERARDTYVMCNHYAENIICRDDVLEIDTADIFSTTSLNGLVRDGQISGKTRSAFRLGISSRADLDFRLVREQPDFFLGEARFDDAWHTFCMAKDQYDCIWYFTDGIIPEPSENTYHP